jgi:hypothetical protein
MVLFLKITFIVYLTIHFEALGSVVTISQCSSVLKLSQ